MNNLNLKAVKSLRHNSSRRLVPRLALLPPPEIGAHAALVNVQTLASCQFLYRCPSVPRNSSVLHHLNCSISTMLFCGVTMMATDSVHQLTQQLR